MGKFASEKFNQLEKYRLEKEDLIKDLKSKISPLNRKIEHIEARVDRQEQYARWNCLLLHGIKKN